jgi:hypothetical protein
MRLVPAGSDFRIVVGLPKVDAEGGDEDEA